jgi:hypothetical protein
MIRVAMEGTNQNKIREENDKKREINRRMEKTA